MVTVIVSTLAFSRPRYLNCGGVVRARGSCLGRHGCDRVGRGFGHGDSVCLCLQSRHDVWTSSLGDRHQTLSLGFCGRPCVEIGDHDGRHLPRP